MKNIFKTSYLFMVAAAVITVGADSSNASTLLRVPGLEINTVNANAFAERASLYSTPNFSPDSSCDIHTSLVLDSAQLSGKLALLEERVLGTCDIVVNQNQRVYRLSTQPIGCGSVIHTGEFANSDGFINKIEIIDHRGRLCRDTVPAKLIVRETSPQETKVLYSANRVSLSEANSPSERAPITCMAFWEGYVSEAGVCKKKSASGCSNPFPFESLASCEDSSPEKPLFLN